MEGVSHFEVYSLSGTKLDTQSVLTPGFYIVKAADKAVKVLVK